MNKVRFLSILFDKRLQAYEIPYLRSAIIEKTKRESDLFHNHLSDKKYIYRYPLIQYKIKNKKPCLICLKEATEDIHYLLKNKDFRFQIGSRTVEMEIEEVNLKYIRVQTWDKHFSYNIHNYIALNQENYSTYKKMDSLVERVGFLQELLHKHLRIFAEEMNAHFPNSLEVKIKEIQSEKYIEYKGVFHLTFCINFNSNLYLPNYIGIGKGSSIGFGIVKKIGKE